MYGTPVYIEKNGKIVAVQPCGAQAIIVGAASASRFNEGLVRVTVSLKNYAFVQAAGHTVTLRLDIYHVRNACAPRKCVNDAVPVALPKTEDL